MSEKMHLRAIILACKRHPQHLEMHYDVRVGAIRLAAEREGVHHGELLGNSTV